jgi:isochorismate synthase
MSAAKAQVAGSHRLAELLDRASEQARASQRPVLVSTVEPAPAVDPLEALAHASSNGGALAEQAAAGRMYWTRPAEGFALAGLGSVAELASAGSLRFETLDREWAALVRCAVTDDASGGAPGVGPLLMGGFAFEPEGPRSARWRGFPSALLSLPRLQHTLTAGDGWLTTSILVGPDGEPDVDLAALSELRAQFVDALEQLTAHAAPAMHRATIAYDEALPSSDWRAAVSAAAASVRAGELEKVVLAREVRATAQQPFSIAAAVRHLRAAYPDCYVFSIWRGARAFVGASPERLVRLDGRDVRTSSLAGSSPRGATPDEDRELAERLLASAKDRVEHAVVRRTLCAALAEVGDDVTAAEEPSVLTLPQVHHLHTPVKARLRPGHSLLDVVERLHPTPAVGGHPRDAALRFICAHEQMDRGWYAAPVGWLGRDHGEFAVALRSALISGAEASLFAGCGVVADSDPDLEYAESELKLRPMESALAAASEDAE